MVWLIRRGGALAELHEVHDDRGWTLLAIPGTKPRPRSYCSWFITLCGGQTTRDLHVGDRLGIRSLHLHDVDWDVGQLGSLLQDVAILVEDSAER